MKYRALSVLLLFPLAFAAAFGIAALVGESALPQILTAQNEAGKILALAGCVAASLAFESGDYLRRAWLFAGGCYLLLLVKDVAGAPALAEGLGSQLGAVQGALALLANASLVAGMWMLAHAFNVAGLEDDDEARPRSRALFAVAVVLSLAVTGWPLLNDVRELARGDAAALVSIASDLGDTICLALAAPVLRTAIAMRGGLLLWPWGFLTAAEAAWIAYDASSDLLLAGHVASRGWLGGSEALRALACGFYFAAGCAQRLTLAPRAPEPHAPS